MMSDTIDFVFISVYIHKQILDDEQILMYKKKKTLDYNKKFKPF